MAEIPRHGWWPFRKAAAVTLELVPLLGIPIFMLADYDVPYYLYLAVGLCSGPGLILAGARIGGCVFGLGRAAVVGALFCLTVAAVWLVDSAWAASTWVIAFLIVYAGTAVVGAVLAASLSNERQPAPINGQRG
jgi:hypothetical protein